MITGEPCSVKKLRSGGQARGETLCANMRETTLSFFKVEGTESFHDRVNRQKS